MSLAGEDGDLLDAWRRGDPRSGEELFRRYFGVVFRFFRGKLPEDVDDMVQRTFLACIEVVRRDEELRSFKAYLLGIARLQLLRYLRERKPATSTVADDELSIHGTLGALSRVLVAREEERVLLDALRRLPVDLQIALELFYWEELPMHEMAIVLAIPEGTVKSRLHRAKKLLRTAIDEVPASAAMRSSTLENVEGWARGLRGQLAGGNGSVP
jgi:RNA polymerase sigma-70 factor (ECF subfamily)